MAELIDKDKVKELPVYEFGVSLLSAEKYVKLSDMEKLLTTTEAEIREKAQLEIVEWFWMRHFSFTSAQDILDKYAEYLKGGAN